MCRHPLRQASVLRAWARVLTAQRTSSPLSRSHLFGLWYLWRGNMDPLMARRPSSSFEYSLFQSVARIFHNVENVFTTSITTQSPYFDVLNGIVAPMVTGQYSVPHTCIATRNTIVSDTNYNKMTTAVQGRYPGGPRRNADAAHVVTGMSDSRSLIDVAIPSTTKGLHMINRMFGSLCYP